MSNITNRDSKYANTQSVQGGLLDVVLALKSNIMRTLKVATLAEVQSIDTKTQIVKVKPFPLIEGESEKIIECETIMTPAMQDKSFTYVSLANQLSNKDVVLVVFLDRNSSQNLSQAKKKQTLSTLKENSELHSDKFGIIVALVNKYE